jgi:hypothetical protein
VPMSVHPRRPSIRTTRSSLTLLLACVLAFLSGPSSGAASKRPPLLVIQYQLVDSAPHPDGTDYVFRARLLNVGPAIPGATARITGASGAATILDDSVTFGPVGRTESAWSTDTFAIRRHGPWSEILARLRWTVTPLTPNQPPVANAGADRTVRVLDLVRLDGSGSTDPDGDPLTYAWSWRERPAGSFAELDDATAVRPAFTVDAAGRYVLALIVHDGITSSEPDLVAVSTENSPPVADAGEDRTVALNALVQLDGSGSSDPDGDPLTFSWHLDERPVGSQAVLDDPAAVRPTLTIDVPGSYVIRLTVHDGLAASQPDTVVLRTDNSPPVADAGPDQTARVGEVVTLDGTGSSDVDGDPLTYAWSLIGRPDGSNAALDSPHSVAPAFVVDRTGVYVAQLIVNDGIVDSAADTVAIDTVNSRPVADAGPDQVIVAGQGAFIDGSGSFDPDGDALAFQWAFTARPAGSSAAIVDPAAPVATFVADMPGDYIVQLIVSDGQLESLPDTVLISTTNAAPTADAGADQLGVPVGATVTLDGSNSTDPDGHGLTYAWSLLSWPSGSVATLSGADAIGPTLTPDVAGDYVVQLIVHDGFASSAPDTVRIQAVAPVVVTIEATADASEVGPETGAFTVARTGSTSDLLEVNLLVQGSATNGVDYETIPNVVTIPAGSSTASVIVMPVDDGLLEGTESVVLSIQPGSGYVVGSPGLAQVLIADSSRPTVTVSATIPGGTRGGSGGGRVHVRANGFDLVSPAGDLRAVRHGHQWLRLREHRRQFGHRDDSRGRIVARTAHRALRGQPRRRPESVIVTISDSSAYLVGTPGSAEVTILDDPAVVSITAIDADASELGPDPGVILISRAGGALSAALDVGLQFSGTASSVDFASVPATVTIPAGETSLQIAIEPRPDNLVEGPETVVVTLAARTTYVVGSVAQRDGHHRGRSARRSRHRHRSGRF